jgi:hypothetical protein
LSYTKLAELQSHFGADLPLAVQAEQDSDEFTRVGWRSFSIEPWAARNHFADLVRQALARLFISRGLKEFELADGRFAWWASMDAAPAGRVTFRWSNVSGSRQLRGFSEKRKMHWHFGITPYARSSPLLHVRLISRLIFTEDGQRPLDSVRMHKLRRSFAKTWRNARWRDMLLAYLYWLSDGGNELTAPTSSDEGFVLSLPPMVFDSPVSITEDVSTDDEEDPSDEEALDITEDYDDQVDAFEDDR